MVLLTPTNTTAATVSSLMWQPEQNLLHAMNPLTSNRPHVWSSERLLCVLWGSLVAECDHWQSAAAVAVQRFAARGEKVHKYRA